VSEIEIKPKKYYPGAEESKRFAELDCEKIKTCIAHRNTGSHLTASDQ
jgi:hypothetical protein